jgi:hypothetical protein
MSYLPQKLPLECVSLISEKLRTDTLKHGFSGPFSLKRQEISKKMSPQSYDKVMSYLLAKGWIYEYAKSGKSTLHQVRWSSIWKDTSYIRRMYFGWLQSRGNSGLEDTWFVSSKPAKPAYPGDLEKKTEREPAIRLVRNPYINRIRARNNKNV